MPSRYNYYQSLNQTPKPKKRKKRLLIYVVAFLVIVGLGYGAANNFFISSKNDDFVKDIKKTLLPAKPVKSAPDYSTLNNAINNVIQTNSNITFGVSIINLNDGAQLNYGDSSPMTAASVSKILTAADFLKEVEAGQQTLGETLDDGNTASYDINQMITVSNDNAWAALDDQLTFAQLQDYANQLGFTSFNYNSNTLSTGDTAKLFSELYEGKLLNATDTKLELSYMLIANYRNFIIPVVPSSDTVYHKVGEYIDNVNDAAIITNGKQTIVLVIFTDGNGAYDWTARATMMQQITTATLNYFGLN